MIDLTEKHYEPLVIESKYPNDTIVIDNGTYEIKSGYLNELCFVTKNNIYKFKNRISMEPFPSSSLKSMFDTDVIVNFDVLEHTVDRVLDILKPKELENLIFTITPYSPTEADLLNFLFEIYSFKKIQLGYDFIYAYHKYFGIQDGLVVSLNHSNVIVAVISSKKIADIYKISFGAKDLYNYINTVMGDKYKNFRVNYKNLTQYMRASDYYNLEAVEIYNQMCEGNYSKCLFLTDAIDHPQDIPVEVKKTKKEPAHSTSLPEIDYKLLNEKDTELSTERLKEKKRQRLIYSGAMFRLKARIERVFKDFDELIIATNDEMEKQHDFENYIEKKKERFYNYRRELELRDKLRKDSRNRRTREFRIKNKEGILNDEELKLKNQIIDAEDLNIEKNIFDKMDLLAFELKALDPDFIPYCANTVEILRGDNIGRQCVNIELIKWTEIFFEPSIVGSEEMGLSEIFENISVKYNIFNVLLCGGLSYIENIDNRIKNELTSLSKVGDVNLIKCSDSQKDAFYGACFSDLFPTYTREEFLKEGAQQLLEKKRVFTNN